MAAVTPFAGPGDVLLAQAGGFRMARDVGPASGLSWGQTGVRVAPLPLPRLEPSQPWPPRFGGSLRAG